MGTNPPSAGFVIARSASSDAYQLWQFDPTASEIFTGVPLDSGASYDRRNSLI